MSRYDENITNYGRLGRGHSPEHEASSDVSYDPMWQFARLAGDIRDPYPTLAEIRESSPVIEVNLVERTGQH